MNGLESSKVTMNLFVRSKSISLAFCCALALALQFSTSLELELFGGIAEAQTNYKDPSFAYEPELLSVVDSIHNGELEQALATVNRHMRQYPKSKLGLLLKADILQAMSVQLNDIGQNNESSSEELQKLRHQLKNRWVHRTQSTKGLFPASLIDMGKHAHVLVADLNAGRLYLYENKNGQPRLIRDYYLSVGSAGFGKEKEGDNKTPVGVYSIYKHIKPDELPDLYGEGAFPLDYPNEFDRSLNRTGHGIWLHGTPSNTYARSPWASEGCVVLSNDDLLNIQKYINIEAKTPIVLTDTLNWITAGQLKFERQKYYKILEKWRSDWESLNVDAYASHYSKDNFNFGSEEFSTWLEQKRQVNDGKSYVQLSLDIESLIVYPGQSDMFVVRYTQHYLSNNYSGSALKEQYWRKNKAGLWKIVYEG